MLESGLICDLLPPGRGVSAAPSLGLARVAVPHGFVVAAPPGEALTMQRFGRRSYGTLVKIWPRDAPAAASSDGPCVYVTGFMTDTKDDGYWESWMPAHQQLVSAPLPWPEQAYGYRWQTGATGDWLGRWPLPVHAAALLARRSSPATLLAGMTADSLVNATRCTLTATTLTTLTP